MSDPGGDREARTGDPIAHLADVVGWLVARAAPGGPPPAAGRPEAAVASAFLIALGGPSHRYAAAAEAILREPPEPAPGDLVDLARRGVGLVRDEVAGAASDVDFARTLAGTAERLRDPAIDPADAAEACWALFVPEAGGILGHEIEREAAVRRARTVVIDHLAADPITDPGREILFTSNVLLTLPAHSTPAEALDYAPDILDAIGEAAGSEQRYWYDHPIQIGVDPGRNELLYGLRALDEAVGFERRRAGATDAPRIACLLSVSVTHEPLRRIGRRYVEAELARAGPLRHLEVYVLTETEADRLLDEVLLGGTSRPPATVGPETVAALRDVVGVDGEYGRHYSLLKAIATLWHVLIDPEVRATFKIDLDQVFPQDVLVAETGSSAFEHLATTRWGAAGRDAEGRPVELGMIAGALVNERDIGRGLFTPDVEVPRRRPTPAEHVFFSALPQALSTRAEMMARYGAQSLDGERTALERVHVTGGTNGIRVDALRRHRPFTPSFVGRAEDQAYILSALGRPGPRLAYVHEPGLIMRHDKEAFAGEAIAAAHVGKLIGDDVRIVVFSALAAAMADGVSGDDTAGGLDRRAIKRLLDPFTGAFVSPIPRTLALLRFALRTLSFFDGGADDAGREYARDGARRLAAAIELTADAAAFRATIERERAGWALYYDTLDALEAGLAAGDAEARRRRGLARAIIDGSRVTTAEP